MDAVAGQRTGNVDKDPGQHPLPRLGSWVRIPSSAPTKSESPQDWGLLLTLERIEQCQRARERGARPTRPSCRSFLQESRLDHRVKVVIVRGVMAVDTAPCRPVPSRGYRLPPTGTSKSVQEGQTRRAELSSFRWDPRSPSPIEPSHDAARSELGLGGRQFK